MSVDVGTRWYKAPEILYGSRNYDQSVDIWSAGCILAELLDTTPLFTGSNDLDQIWKIQFFIGKPHGERDTSFFSLLPKNHFQIAPNTSENESQFKFKVHFSGCNEKMVSLLEQMLRYS